MRTPPEIADVAHLHEDAELDLDTERPNYNKEWLETYPSAGYEHPAELWSRWLTKRAPAARSLLDIGGGNGILAMPHWNAGQITLLDIAPEVNFAHLGRVVIGDCETALDTFGEKSFDCVQFTECIEHLRKVKGRRMLEMLPKLARQALIVTTPGGFSRQPEVLGNPYNVHISGWTPPEFLEHGYEVHMNASQIIATMWPETLSG